MRVFIGLTEVSGYYSNLKRGFDELGVPATYISLHAHPFNYGETVDQPALASLARYCVARRVRLKNRRSLRGAFWWLMVLLTRLPLFLWALARFDVFILGGGSSFFHNADLPLLKLFRKKIVYMFHGTDSRPGYMDGFCEGIPRASPRPFEQLSVEGATDGASASELAEQVNAYLRATKRRWSNVRWIERFADVPINHPAHGHFHTRPFVVSLIIGLPYHFQPAEPRTTNAPQRGARIRVLHSPSQPEGKGTYHIRRAIEAVKAQGVQIDFVEITGRPNVEVLQELAECDFVVDQAFSDFPMAAFAMEAAFFGKPAVVGGYYSAILREDLKEEWIPPSLYCHPERLEQAIEKLVIDPDYRRELGARAKDFVEKNWTAIEVARRYVRLIRGDVPENWWYQPQRIKYVHGNGLSESRARKIVRAIVEQQGREALLVADKPELEKRFLEFAYSESPDVAATV